jgi:hypothetical protein
MINKLAGDFLNISKRSQRRMDGPHGHFDIQSAFQDLKNHTHRGEIVEMAEEDEEPRSPQRAGFLIVRF